MLNFDRSDMPRFLGIGNAFRPDLGTTSCVISKGPKENKNSELHLIDCGWDVFGKLKKYKYLEDRPNITVYITHTHNDHIGSLGTLIEYQFYINRKRCHIYYHEPEQLMKILDGMMVDRSMYIITESRSHNPFSDESNYNIPHVIKNNQVINSYAFKIESTTFGSPTCIFSWDACSISNDIYNKYLADPANTCLFHDCCLANYPGNVHTYYKLLLDLVPEKIRSNVFPVHVDDEEVLDIMVVAGFGDVRELLI